MYCNIPENEISKAFTDSLAIAKSETDPVLVKMAFEKNMDNRVKEMAFKLGKDYLQLWSSLMDDPAFTEKLNAFEMAIDEMMRQETDQG